MLASNTPLLTLPLSRDSDQADSLRPKEFDFTRTTHLGFTAMAYQLGVFLPRSLFFLWQAYNRYIACLFEKSGGSSTIDTIT